MEYYRVGAAYPAGGVAHGERRIPYDQLRPLSLGQVADPSDHRRGGQEDWLPGPGDDERLVSIKYRRPGMRGGVHGDVVRRKPAPQLP